MRILAIVIAGLFLSACNQATINSYCALAKPLTWSKRDTRQTIRGIVGHNKTWLSQNCGKIK